MFSAYVSRLLSLGSVNRASACTSTAIKTFISVNNILAVLLGNATNGTFGSASAAADAIIRNLISHDKYLRN